MTHITHTNKFSQRVQATDAETCVSAIKSADYAISAAISGDVSEEQLAAARKLVEAMEIPDVLKRAQLEALKPNTNKLDAARIETHETFNRIVSSIRKNILPATLSPDDVAKLSADDCRKLLQTASDLWNKYGKVVPSKTQSN